MEMCPVMFLEAQVILYCNQYKCHEKECDRLNATYGRGLPACKRWVGLRSLLPAIENKTRSFFLHTL